MIEIKGVSYRYLTKAGEPVYALKGIDLTIRERERVAIIGPNGSGKTTLARCLNGLLFPTRGEIRIDRLKVGDQSTTGQIRRLVGMVFQNPDNQIVSTTVEREIAFGLENIGLAAVNIGRRVEWALQSFHLEGYRDFSPHRLSGGEKQRLSLASVLAMRPKYLILDEPTSLLDPIDRKEVIQIISHLDSFGISGLIHISQFPEETILFPRLIVLNQGRILLDGPPEEIFSQREALRRIGLKPPPLLELVEELKEQGIYLKGSLHKKPAELVRALLKLRGRKRPQVKTPIFEDKVKLPSAIEAKSLFYTYNPDLPHQKEALRGVDLRVDRGELVGLIGPTGSGKTTLAQHFNLLLTPSSGWVSLFGQRFNGVDPQVVRRKVGFLFQFPENQLFEETVYKDVAFGPSNLKLPQGEIKERVKESLERVRLRYDQFASRSPFSLSGGEQRRVALAGVLSMGPQLLILDEPTVGLDPAGSDLVAEILKELHSQGKTIVLISHNLDFVFGLASRVIALDKGKICLQGPSTIFMEKKETLQRIGLDLPPLNCVMVLLRKAGFNVGVTPSSAQDAARQISKQVQKSLDI